MGMFSRSTLAACSLIALLSTQANAETAKSYKVAGLTAPAEIIVDRWGVPHIYASETYDAFFVQGFNAARDRLWQIDLWRKRGLGRTGEGLRTGLSGTGPDGASVPVSRRHVPRMAGLWQRRQEDRSTLHGRRQRLHHPDPAGPIAGPDGIQAAGISAGILAAGGCRPYPQPRLDPESRQRDRTRRRRLRGRPQDRPDAEDAGVGLGNPRSRRPRPLRDPAASDGELFARHLERQVHQGEAGRHPARGA